MRQNEAKMRNKAPSCCIILFISHFPRLIEQIRCPGYASGASVYPQGAKCHVRCRGGFRLKGTYTRRCVTGGRWNGEEPICLPEAMTDPPYNPSNRTRFAVLLWPKGRTARVCASKLLARRSYLIGTFIR